MWFELVCLLAGSLTVCNFLVLLPSSLPRVVVIDQQRCDWPASLRTGGLMVSLALRRRTITDRGDFKEKHKTAIDVLNVKLVLRRVFKGFTTVVLSSGRAAGG